MEEIRFVRPRSTLIGGKVKTAQNQKRKMKKDGDAKNRIATLTGEK